MGIVFGCGRGLPVVYRHGPIATASGGHASIGGHSLPPIPPLLVYVASKIWLFMPCLSAGTIRCPAHILTITMWLVAV